MMKPVPAVFQLVVNHVLLSAKASQEKSKPKKKTPSLETPSPSVFAFPGSYPFYNRHLHFHLQMPFPAGESYKE